MLTIEVATDTEVMLDGSADGHVAMAGFVELLETALLSQDVVDWLKEHPRLQPQSAPWSPVRPSYGVSFRVN